jgi:zinc transport system substrate-binding protein
MIQKDNKNWHAPNILFLLILPLFLLPSQALAKTLNVGVTLHPYYSWVANIAGDTVNLTTVIPENSDPHSYQIRPKDLANLEKLDCIVVNNLGHDDYINAMLKAAGREDIRKIEPNKGIPLIADIHKKFKFQKDKKTQVSYNSHTYVSILTAIQQINNIANDLALLSPENSTLYKRNARRYSKRLRAMLRRALKSIDVAKAETLTIATVHDGYAYMFQELGVTVDAVIQPRHGIEPSARQLADTIKRINRAKVNVLFTEVDYKKKYVDTIFQETGCQIFKMSHISYGAYTAEKFEQDMQANIDTLIKALGSSQ